WSHTDPHPDQFTTPAIGQTGGAALSESLDLGDRLPTVRGVLSFCNQYARLPQSRVVWLLSRPGGLQRLGRGVGGVTPRPWGRHGGARGVVVLYRQRNRDDVHRDDDRDSRARVGDLLCDAKSRSGCSLAGTRPGRTFASLAQKS